MLHPDGKTILEEAAEIVNGPRQGDYGHPLENHSLTAQFWNCYLQSRKRRLGMEHLSGDDVCLLMILQKIARTCAGGVITRDALVDIAGYSANIEMIAQKVETASKEAIDRFESDS